VAIYCGSLSGLDLAQQVTAHGGNGNGNGNSPGAVGTVYTCQAGAPGQLLLASHGTPAGVWTPLGLAINSVFQVENLVISGTNVVAMPAHEMPIQANTVAVLDGALLTHQPTTAAQEFSLRLSITNSLVVDSNSLVDVSGRGYTDGYTVGDTTTGAATGRSGGSYGGLGAPASAGGQANSTYGDYHNPNELGSAGAGPQANGGAGGGLVRVSAASVRIDGALLANGANAVDTGDWGGGGGSGGGIWLNVVSLSGSGLIAANGGAPVEWGAAGGGGRVAIYYGSLSGLDLAHQVTAHGGNGNGNGNSPGAVGTVYTRQAGTPGQLLLASHGTPVGTWTPLGLGTDTVFQVENLVISGQGMLVAPAHEMPIQAGSVAVVNGAILTHQPTTLAQEYSLRLTITNSLLMDSNSVIDVSGRGYINDGNLGALTLGNTNTGAASGRSGGSYGGLGAPASGGEGNSTYGDYHNPNELGSAGAGPQANGGAGGGLVRISAASAQLDGGILANGANAVNNGNWGGGGGSGGGVWLSVGSLSGGGLIAANGGSGNNWGVEGGGGRVAVYYGTVTGFDLTNRVTAHGGNGNDAGAVGTVYLEAGGAVGELLLASHGTPAGAWTPLGLATNSVFQVENLVISGTNVVAMPAHEMLIQANAVAVLDGALLTHQPTTAAQEFSLRLSITNSLVVDSNSLVDVSGRGYTDGYTVGDTTNAAASGRSGGSYGGLGAPASGGQANSTYGDSHNPNELGSGGAGPQGNGGTGGGLVRISAASAQVDGQILANGANAVNNGNWGGGGGSGGGIMLNAGSLGGSGQIAANGGAPASWGAAGGGGRVAIYSTGLTFPATNAAANAGAGGPAGAQPGTVLFSATPYCLWDSTNSFLHGVEQVGCEVLGLGIQEPVSVQVSAAYAGTSYLIGVGTSQIVSLSWDTTTVPDGVYELGAAFRLNTFQVIGELSQTVLVNNSVAWHSGLVTTNQIWSAGEVHVVEGNLIIGQGVTVTIEPGAVVKFVHGSGITVEDGGVLDAPATASGPIIFTSFADDTAGGDSNLDGNNSMPVPGDWLGVTVEGTGQFNAAAYVDLRYAISMHGGTLSANETWPGTLVHLVNQNLVVPGGVTLTLEPGAVVKFAAGVGMAVQTGGVLNAPGTVAQPIILTSFTDGSVGGGSNGQGSATTPQPGDWVGLSLASGQATLNHCDIRYGGNTGSGGFASGVIIVDNGSLVLSNSTVESTLYDGISVYGASGNALIVSSVLRDTDRAIWAYGGGNVLLVNCTFDQNLAGLDNHVSQGIIEAENCIIANSTTGSSIEGPVTLRYCDLWSEYAGSSNPAVIGQNGNISADPKFVNESLADYRLNYGSPCINSADAMVAPPLDAAGSPLYNDPRTVVKTGVPNTKGLYADMGAFEFVETAPSDVDLVPTQVSGPGFVTAGDWVLVQWTIANLGSGIAVGPWHDTVYLAPARGTGAPLWAAEVLDGTLALGPGETVTVTNSVRVPGGAEGAYQWQVRVNSRGEVFEGINWTNSLASGAATVQLQVPELVVGANPIPRQLNAQGESQWFKVQPPAGQDVLVTLSTTGNSATLEMYSGQGYMPTQLNYDAQQTASSGSAATLLLPGGAATTYYLLLYAQSLPGGAASYNLAAQVLNFSLTQISSATTVGNTGPVTIDVRGGQLTANLAYQVIGPDGQPIAATSVYAVNSSEVFVTFDLSGHPLGNYQLQAGESGRTVALTNAIAVINGNPGYVDISVASPANIRPYQLGVVVIQYRNAGDVDVAAPLMDLETQFADLISPSSQLPVGNGLLLLGINQQGPAGILPPGAGGTIALIFEAQAGGNCVFNVSLAALPTDPMDWSDMEAALQADGMDAGAWNLVWTNFLGDAGLTIGQFNALLAERATQLGSLGVRVSEVDQLLTYLLRQADQYGAISHRFNLSAFGRGWSNPLDISAQADAQGNVSIEMAGTGARLFRYLSPGYAPLQGDPAVLTNAVDHYELREPNGILWVFRPDGRLNYLEDPKQQRLTYNYTGALATSVTDPYGDVTAITYNAAGRITQITDPVGMNTTFAYDPTGEHLISIASDDGTTNLFRYVTDPGAAAQHAVQTAVLPDGSQINYEYDARGGLQKVAQGNGPEAVALAPNPNGGVSLTYADGSVLGLIWDQFGQLRQMIDPLGGLTSFAYDANHNLVQTADPTGAKSSLSYDPEGNLSAQVDADGQRGDLTYDPTFNLPIRFRSQRGNETLFAYNAQASLEAITYPDGSAEQFAYDSMGKATQSINARGQAIQYSYSDKGLLLQKQWPDGSKVQLGYDARRNLTNVNQIQGNVIRTTSYAYDAGDRLIRVVDSNNRTLGFAYNSGGKRTQMKSSDGLIVNYAYDENGRLWQLTDGAGHTNVTYGYDDLGRLARKNLGNGMATTFEYDAVGQITRLVNNAPDGAVLSQFDYAYDEAGRCTNAVTLQGTNVYTYDAMGQLTGLTLPDGHSIDYSYDAEGNRTTVADDGVTTAYMANALNEYATVGGFRCQYDADGNLISKTDDTSQWTYSYDAENNLVEAASSSEVWEYEYDGFGQMAAVVHNGQRTEYLVDPAGGGQIVGEYGDQGEVLAQYVYGVGLNSRVTPGSGSSYYAYDANGNTVQVTDNAGQVLNLYEYLPFGEPTVSNESVPNPFKFGGMFGLRDGGAGLVLARARYYDPAWGRFITRDPAGLPVGNRYLYAVNDPLLYVDRTGADFEKNKQIVDWANDAGGTYLGVLDYAYRYQRSGILNHMKEISQALKPGAGGLSQELEVTLKGSYNAATKSLSCLSEEVSPQIKILGKAGSVLGWLGVASTGYELRNSVGTYLHEGGSDNGYQLLHDTGSFIAAGVSLFPPFAYVGILATATDYISKYGTAWYYNEDEENYYRELDARYRVYMKKRFKGRVFTATTKELTSWDPNDITGPAGYGQQSFVSVDFTMYYLIQFANKTNATAPAQVVVVTNQLPAALDYSTFELGNMGFGTNVVTVPPGRTFYSSQVDARSTLGLYVDVQGQFDAASGLAVWTFTSIDPVTGAGPEDPLAGFLPPDSSPPAGEGWVRYSVKPLAATADGSQISAQAAVYFDTNPAIDTPTITNAVDSFTPTSHIIVLPATSPPTFTVSWTGTDGKGSGIVGYDIFVATNQAPYGVWLEGTTNTSAAFTGLVGSTYAFYSIATDGVGHRELPPAVAEAVTLVVAPASTNAPSLQNGPLMNVARMGHYIGEMPDGSAVVFGGHGQGFAALNSIEIWRPAANSFTLAPAPFTFDGGALVRLADGRYLMAGGAANLGVAPGYNTAQLFDPVAGTVASTGTTMVRPRMSCRGAALTGGKVLIAGGWYDTASATYGELFDPATGLFAATGALRTPRAQPVVLPTTDGKAVIAGGMGVYGSPSFFEQVELYDPVQNSFSVLTNALFPGETGWALTPEGERAIQDQETADGRYVLQASRVTNSVTEVVLAIFDPTARKFTKLAMSPAFTDPVSVWLPVVSAAENAVYFLSGYNTNNSANLIFRVQRVDLATGQRVASDELSVTNYYPGSSAAVLLKDGRLFVTGGTTAVDSQFNFEPVQNTFFVEGLPAASAAGTGPRLNWSRVGKTITLSWPSTATGYIVQSTGNLGGAAAWNSVTNSPTVVGDQNTVTVDITGRALFFRLKK